jgi:integrase
MAEEKQPPEEYTFASRHSSFGMTNSFGTWIDTQSGTPGQHITTTSVGQMCLKARRRSKIPKPITPHSVRHAFEFLACLMRREELQLVGVEGLLQIPMIRWVSARRRRRTKTVPECGVFAPRGLVLSEEQIPQIVENNEK